MIDSAPLLPPYQQFDWCFAQRLVRWQVRRQVRRSILRSILGALLLGAAPYLAAPSHAQQTEAITVVPLDDAATGEAASVASPQRPDPTLIRWEILNRFTPFNTLPDPEATFAAYAYQPGENARDWHARLWARDGAGFASPYASALADLPPFRNWNNTLRHPARDALPWDAKTDLHRAPVREVLRNETNPDYTVRVRLSYASAEACVWDLGTGPLRTPLDCSVPEVIEVPITGGSVRLTLDTGGGDLVVPIVPQHEVIVGLGDSFASGEGNPDLPARWREGLELPENRTTWLRAGDHTTLTNRARWLDERCHRSFFSHQSLTALQRASADPHKIVTFLHYACTGAEVLNGVLLPQVAPGRVNRWVAQLNRYSQVNAAVLELCQSDRITYAKRLESISGPVSVLEALPRRGGYHDPRERDEGAPSTLTLGDLFDVKAQDIYSDQVHGRGGFLTCALDQIRTPDMVLLSIGGNDIGFGNLIRYYLTPLDSPLYGSFLPPFCPAAPYRFEEGLHPNADEHCLVADKNFHYDTGSLIGRWKDKDSLGARYRLLLRALDRLLGVPPVRVVMAQYPDPLRAGPRLPEDTVDTAYCGRLTSEQVFAPVTYQTGPELSPFEAIKGLTGFEIGATRGWTLDLTREDSVRALNQIEDFRAQIVAMAKGSGIILACGGRDALTSHGWWRGGDLNLPSHGGANGSIGARWDPATWQTYAYKDWGRGVRTANDSMMTQASGSGDIHGIFHPNLLGHTRLADAVAKRLAEAEATGQWPGPISGPAAASLPQ